MPLWDVGQTARLASQGMNQSQEGWDQLQGWLDEKAKREREAARQKRISDAIEEERQKVEAAKTGALERSGLERISAYAKAQGIDEAALQRDIEAAGAAEAAASSPEAGKTSAVNLPELLKKREAAVSTLERFKKAREDVSTMAKQGGVYVAEDGTVHSSPDAYRFELKAGYEGKKKKREDDAEVARVKRLAELDEATRKQAVRMLARDYSPEDAARIMDEAEFAKENQRLLDEQAKLDPKDKKGQARLDKKFAALEGVSRLFNENSKLARGYSLEYYKRTGADLAKAQEAFDRGMLDTSEDVLGIQAEDAKIAQLEQSGMRLMAVDPTGKLSENMFAEAAARKDKLNAKIQQAELRRLESRDRNLSGQVNASRTVDYQANQLQTKKELDKAKDALALELQRLKNSGAMAVANRNGEVDILVQQLKNAQAGENNVAKIRSTIFTALGLVSTYGGDAGLEAARKAGLLAPTGSAAAGANAISAARAANQAFGIERDDYQVQEDPRYNVDRGVIRDRTTIEGGGITKGSVTGAKKEKKGAAHPYSPEKVAAAAKKGLVPTQRPDGSWYFGKK